MTETETNGTRVFHVDSVPRDVFFALQAMKAELHCDQWLDFMKALAAHQDDVVRAVRGQA